MKYYVVLPSTSISLNQTTSCNIIKALNHKGFQADFMSLLIIFLYAWKNTLFSDVIYRKCESRKRSSR